MLRSQPSLASSISPLKKVIEKVHFTPLFTCALHSVTDDND